MRALSLNERRLIELVASKGPLARTDLSDALGLTGATVTRIVTELADFGLFDEEVDRQGRGGQPKRMLSVRPGRYFAAGLTFSRSSFQLALLDLSGRIIAQRSVQSGDLSSVDIAGVANSTLARMLDTEAIDRNAVVGLGCAMPGNFQADGKRIHAHGVFADLDDPATLERFVSAFDLPILLENDGKSAVISEHVYGQAPDDGPSMFFIHLGHGVGGGAVINGAPFRGVNGNACLPGFLFPYGAPRPSGLDLMETLAQSGQTVADFSELESLDRADPVLLRWIERAGTQLGDAARAATAFFRPVHHCRRRPASDLDQCAAGSPHASRGAGRALARPCRSTAARRKARAAGRRDRRGLPAALRDLLRRAHDDIREHIPRRAPGLRARRLVRRQDLAQAPARL